MSIYAIGDLHLGIKINKKMDKFGEDWCNHTEKIIKNWNTIVNKDDTVIIVGDISWAMNVKDATYDLDFVHELNGEKVLIQGNHDYWWNSTNQLNRMYDDMFFVKNNYYNKNGVVVCGSRGWINESKEAMSKQDIKVANREANRLKHSILLAISDGVDVNDIIVALHYPPIMKGVNVTEFQEIIEEFNIKKVVYGHLHGKDNFGLGVQGVVGECEYRLVSGDYLGFVPYKVR